MHCCSIVCGLPPTLKEPLTHSRRHGHTHPDMATHPCTTQHGTCKFGSMCRYRDLPGDACLHFLQGKCRFSDATCRLKHVTLTTTPPPRPQAFAPRRSPDTSGVPLRAHMSTQAHPCVVQHKRCDKRTCWYKKLRGDTCLHFLAGACEFGADCTLFHGRQEAVAATAVSARAVVRATTGVVAAPVDDAIWSDAAASCDARSAAVILHPVSALNMRFGARGATAPEQLAMTSNTTPSGSRCCVKCGHQGHVGDDCRENLCVNWTSCWQQYSPTEPCGHVHPVQKASASDRHFIAIDAEGTHRMCSKSSVRPS